MFVHMVILSAYQFVYNLRKRNLMQWRRSQRRYRKQWRRSQHRNWYQMVSILERGTRYGGSGKEIRQTREELDCSIVWRKTMNWAEEQLEIINFW